MFARQDASNRLTTIELTAIISGDGHRWLEARERVCVWHCREGLESKEYDKHVASTIAPPHRDSAARIG
jgi:hypothetical protein